jgi:hypothetical protein
MKLLSVVLVSLALCCTFLAACGNQAEPIDTNRNQEQPVREEDQMGNISDMEFIEKERQRIDALLGTADMRFEEAQLDIEPSQIGALAGWRFITIEGDVEADVYLFDSVEKHPAAIELLQAESAAAPSEEPYTIISSNGTLLFIARYTGPQEEQATGQFRVMTVAGALAGEE